MAGTPLVNELSLESEGIGVRHDPHAADIETSNQACFASQFSSVCLRWDMNSSATDPSMSR
jgi:hypothetical protein